MNESQFLQFQSIEEEPPTYAKVNPSHYISLESTEPVQQQNWGSIHEFLSPSSSIFDLQRSIIKEDLKQSHALFNIKPSFAHSYDITQHGFNKRGKSLNLPNLTYDHISQQKIQSVINNVSPLFMSKIHQQYNDSKYEQSYVFKPVKKIIVRQTQSKTNKSTNASTNGNLDTTMDPDMVKGHVSFQDIPYVASKNQNFDKSIRLFNESFIQNGHTSDQKLGQDLINQNTHRNQAMLKRKTLSLNIESNISEYKKMLNEAKPRIGSFRMTDESDELKKKKFEADEDKFSDLPLFDSQAGAQKKLNNLYKIKIKVEEQIKQSNDESQKQYQSATGGSGNNQGPSSKKNFSRYNYNIKKTIDSTGVRRVHDIKESQLVGIIKEAPMNEETEELVPSHSVVLEKDNPLITDEYNTIIEAAMPKHTMQQLLGLNNNQFLVFKRAEEWIKKRIKTQSNFSSKEKHVEFAKELFKIWDDDNSGVLELDEISHPLVSLGLSTDSKFVTKLIQSLNSQRTNKVIQIQGETPSLQFTLKDFVKIFKADKVGERISKIIKKTCIEKKKKLQLQQIKAHHRNLSMQNSPHNQSPMKSQNNLRQDFLISHQASVESMENPHNVASQSHFPNIHNILASKESTRKKEQIIKNPAISELMEIVYDWWQEVDPTGRLEQPLNKVAELLVSKGISQDEDTAKKVLFKYLDKKDKIITCEDFNQLFCKCIFKDALIDMTEDIERMNQDIVEMPLTLKLGQYQRQLMMQGLDKEQDNAQKGRAIMHALFNLQIEKDPQQKNLKYQSFIVDPFGYEIRKLEEEKLKLRKVDQFAKNINLASNKESLKQIRQNKHDIDYDIIRAEQDEEKIADKGFLIDMKIKQKFSIQTEPKQQAPRFSQVNKLSNTTRAKNESPSKGKRGSDFEKATEGDNTITNIRAKNKRKKSAAKLAQYPQYESFDDLYEEQWQSKYKSHRLEKEIENETVSKTKNSGTIAMISRFMELSGNQRLETVKLPQIYKERQAQQREEDEFDLLENFQKVINVKTEFHQFQ